MSESENEGLPYVSCFSSSINNKHILYNGKILEKIIFVDLPVTLSNTFSIIIISGKMVILKFLYLENFPTIIQLRIILENL